MKGLLKFVTCGSVDDGKSTLIGHMLYDAKLIFADQREALLMENKIGGEDGKIDYSLLLDGLMAEREQGITIDVAYRFFTTEKRSFIVADAPGHEEYTRNMAVGASFADLALILLDASKGILTQTMRHMRICKMMGIRHFIFAVNKMDAVQYRRDVFERLEADIRRLAKNLKLPTPVCIPLSATNGDNLTCRSENMPWYPGETLLSLLENAETEDAPEQNDFIMPVQRVCRPDAAFRGFQGEIVSGHIALGDEIAVYPSGERAAVASILMTDRKASAAAAGQPVTLRMNREIDISRGCVISKTPLLSSHIFSASLLWMDDNDLLPGRSYFLKLSAKVVTATVLRIKCRTDIESGASIAADRIRKNEIAMCDIVLSERIVLAEFEKRPALGRFILIDRVSNMTSACGTVSHVLRRADNLVWQDTSIVRETRARSLGQKPVTLWFTGLSGSGKSTLANAVEQRLHYEGRHTMLLDGDNVRMGLNRDLGFTESDRIENIRRIAEVARLMNDAGLIVLTAFISPYAVDRRVAREIIGASSFFEIYVSTPLAECEHRDVKGLYKKARSGLIPNFTGIQSPYEIPTYPQIEVDTSSISVDDAVSSILDALRVF